MNRMNTEKPTKAMALAMGIETYFWYPSYRGIVRFTIKDGVATSLEDYDPAPNDVDSHWIAVGHRCICDKARIYRRGYIEFIQLWKNNLYPPIYLELIRNTHV